MSKFKLAKKIYFFIGTTTELIKLAPVIKELEKRKLKFKVITSGQTKVNFDELKFLIKKRSADIHLGQKAKKSSTFLFLVWFLKTILKIPFMGKEFAGLNKNNSYFIIHGDPVSSFVGAILATFYGLKLVHIESGLRSFNFLEPFPEEICRFIISKLADIHFCPNEWSLNNLKNERGERINTFENTQIEGYQKAIVKKTNFEKEIGLKNNKTGNIKKYFVLIMHRQEHVIFGKSESEKLIKFIFKNMGTKLNCIFITHATTMSFLDSIGFKLNKDQEERVKFVSRLKYIDFVNLISKSEFLITDGGSNQEETYYMGLPCLVLRNVTERIEGLKGNVVLSKNRPSTIKRFMENYKKYKRRKVEVKIRPSKIIVDYLLK